MTKITEIPSVDAALAYADGYAEGIKDCKNADVAALITERDALSAQLAAEKALVVYYRTLAQLYAAPPHDIAAQRKIITDGCDISDIFDEERKLYEGNDNA